MPAIEKGRLFMADAFHFSKREQEVIKLLLQGKSNKQIAGLLGISVSTVEYHLKNIYAKLKVNSRTEAIAKLMDPGAGGFQRLWNSITALIAKLMTSIGTVFSKLGISTVARDPHKIDNKYSPSRASGTRMVRSNAGFQEVAKFLRKHAILIAGAILLIALSVFVFSKPLFTRECEYPDEATVGQMIIRSNASNSKVHGQFGTTADSPYPEKTGYVTYQGIRLPQIDKLYLKLRYSKDSSSSVPILVFIDDEPVPRASIYPENQHSWNQFAWTEPIFLGSIQSGVHSIRFFTDGQQYGVADLDKLVLSRKRD
jgi:DNA-binding CsgD family transcriptional regulator